MAISKPQTGVSREGHQRVAQYLGVSVLAVCAGIAAAVSTELGAALIVAALLGLYIWYAKIYPRGAFIAMFASISLIPVYAAPTHRSFSPEPTAVAALVVALALTRIGRRVHFTIVDLTFAATCGAMILAAELGPHSLFATGSELFLWIPAYLAGRAICMRRSGAQTFVFAAAIAGLISLPFIAYETITRNNVFFSLARPGTALTEKWARPAFRPGGLLRSQGAFGHPLSMSLIVGSCVVFALALALRTSSRRRQIIWLLAAAALVIGQYTSHERSGWFVVIGGVFLLAMLAIPHGARMRYAFALGLIVVPLAFLAISATHPRNGEASVARTESTADRIDLWRHAFEPGALGLVGLQESTTFNHFANSIRPGQVAIDSGLLQVGDVYGVVAFIALLTVVGAVVRVAIRFNGTWVAVIPAVALVDLAVLSVIAFQTQVPIFVWLVVGAVSGIDVRKRSLETRSPTHARPLT